ncbi:MAG TPA: DUF4412 domain-containing protein [Oligoflexia bacterium]|nr:DUF4412 domain-containing protein [Oligoflexia bacterium]HMR25338.1 DUF4412 domain-containing protein [Oligoflexia bacterium]
MMRSMYFILLLSGLLFSVYAKGVVINYELKVNQENHNMSGSMQAFYQNGMTRVEMNFKNMPMGNMIHLSDAKNNVNYTLFPEKKSYMEHTVNEAVHHKNSDDFKPTKDKKTIAGHSCQVYEKKSQTQIENVCLSDSLYKKYKPMMAAFYTNKKRSILPKDIKGFPLEFESKKGNKLETQVTVVSLKEENIKSSMFTLPKDYKKMNTVPVADQDMEGMKKSMMDAMKNGGMDAKKIEEMKKMAEEMKKKYQNQ